MSAGISPIRDGEYLLRAVAHGREDYYVGSGEAPGRWLGGGAEELGLSGTVDADDFRRVLAGKHPTSGEQLVRAKVRGFDCTFSPPKSISVLWGLGGSEVAAIVQEAHREAVAAALGYLEAEASGVSRRLSGRGGPASIVPTSGFVAAAFDHRTSRAGDPQLHSHVVIANLAHAPGDRWRALGRHPSLYENAKCAEALYECELRRLLSERLGADWSWDDRHPEVVGVPEVLADHYSKRHKEALAAVAAQGLDASPQAMQAAVLSTRRPKPGHHGEALEWSPDAGDYGVEPAGVEGLRQRWERERREAGLPALDLSQVLGQAVEHEVDLAAFSAELAGPHGLTEDRASFSRRDVIRAYAGLPGAGAREAIRLADAWLVSGEVVSLGSRNGAPERFTTWDLLGCEDHLSWALRSRAGAGAGQVAGEVVEAVVAGRGLSDEQAAMVRVLCTSGRGTELVVGRAGVGKTFALDAAREAWEAAGYEVLGAALSAAAAGQLRKGARVTATTIARQIIETYRDGLPEGCVLIVDEAGMADTRSLATLSRAVERANGKLVLVGDDKQLPPISAGGMFSRLVALAGDTAVELTEVRRQASELDRAALAEVRHGDLEAGLRGLLSRDDRLVVTTDASSLHEAIVHDWADARSEGKDVLMLARSRRRVEDLAVAAREARRAGGELGGEELEVKLEPEPTRRRSERVWLPETRSYAVGDGVLFGKNVTGRWKHLRDQMAGVFNGKSGTVVGLDPEAGTLRVRLAGDSDAEVKWGAARAEQAREIETLRAELDKLAEAGASKDETRPLRRRLHRLLDDRKVGIVTVDGRRVSRPGTEIEVDADYLRAGHISYAYARTIHKSQGATCDLALLDGSDMRGREASYVALSRHRQDVRLYLTANPPSADLERHQAAQERPAEPLAEFAARASKVEAQQAARQHITREAEARRRAVRALAQRPEDELEAERQDLEAQLAGASRPELDPEVERLEGELARAEAGGEAAKVWLARRRLAAARERAARAALRAAASEAEARSEERARLADLRAAERARQRTEGEEEGPAQLPGQAGGLGLGL